jgi:Mrp family chromosome partitioning ATPase
MAFVKSSWPQTTDDQAGCLAQACWLLHDVDRPRIVELIAARAGEGTTTVARELAGTAAALAKSNVLLIEAAPPPGSFGSRPGLIELMAASSSLEAAIQPLGGGVDTARLAGGGGLRPELLKRSSLAPLWQAVRARYPLTVIDAPALERGIDGIALGAQVDAVVIVVEAERTRAPVVERLVSLLQRAGAPLAGSILNKRRFYVPSFIYDHF